MFANYRIEQAIGRTGHGQRKTIMTTIGSHEAGARRPVTVFAASDPATGPPGNIMPVPWAVGAGGLRPQLGRNVGAALARGGHVVEAMYRWMHDALARRRTVRDLRLLGRSRLADLGIEPDRIEHVADAMIAARRNGTAMRRGRSRPRSG